MTVFGNVYNKERCIKALLANTESPTWWETSAALWRLYVGMRSLAPSRQSWSEEELKQISRLKEACRTIDYYRLECGQTDEGDPWCSLCDDRDHSVAVHIARIDRRYVVIFQSSTQPLRLTNLAGAVDLVVHRMVGMKRIGLIDDTPP